MPKHNGFFATGFFQDECLEDLAVPKLFIHRYLLNLAEANPKALYLYMCFFIQPEKGTKDQSSLSYTPLELEEKTHFALSEIMQALDLLVELKLIYQGKTGYSGQDLKQTYMQEKFLYAYTQMHPQHQWDIPKEYQNYFFGKQEEQSLQRNFAVLQRRLMNEYRQGRWTQAWQALLDECLHRYKWSEELILALFDRLKEKGKLQHIRYAQAIAKQWVEQGIHDVNTLLSYENKYTERQVFFQKVQKLLNKLLTEGDKEMIYSWKENLGFSDEVIFWALKTLAVQMQWVTIEGFNRYFLEWKDKNWKTKSEIEIGLAKQKEEKKESKAGKNYSSRSGSTSRRKSLMAISERDYTEEEVMDMIYTIWDKEKPYLPPMDDEGKPKQ